MKQLGIVLCLLLVLAACAAPERTETEGRFLLAANGTGLLVTENGEPIVLSVETEGDSPWEGFRSGDKITVTHDGIEETYPAKTGAYDWSLLEKGTLEDIPEETLETLEGMGWSFCRDAHEPAAEPRTVEDPISGYCGNTITEVTLNGETYSFWGSDSVALTDILINLSYDPGICRCSPEFTVDTEFGSGYAVNLTESYARYETGQAPLTAEQVETIQGILERNCT